VQNQHRCAARTQTCRKDKCPVEFLRQRYEYHPENHSNFIRGLNNAAGRRLRLFRSARVSFAFHPCVPENTGRKQRTAVMARGQPGSLCGAAWNAARPGGLRAREQPNRNACLGSATRRPIAKIKKPRRGFPPGHTSVVSIFRINHFGDSCKRKPKLDTLRALPQRAQHGRHVRCPR
jgi:hypothetical protein